MSARLTISHEALEAFVLRCAGAVSMPPQNARQFAYGLVEADLRGVGSHGAMRLPAYARALHQGVINARPSVERVRDKAAIEVLDGDNGLGVVLGQIAMVRAVELARMYGIGAVSVRNSNHTGMLAAHLTPAIEASMIGFFTSTGPAIMAPWGGVEPRLGNGPLAYGVPRRGFEPIILDMAASATNRGRIRQFAVAGKELPDGWALDGSGTPTRDATAALQGVVLPAAGHKGYGLAFINEILGGVLVGATLAAAMPREFLKEGSRVLDSWQCGHLAIAIDIAAFGDKDDFFDELEVLSASMKSSPLATGFEEILLPGELEWRNRTRQLNDGIAIDATTVAKLDELADELGIVGVASS